MCVPFSAIHARIETNLITCSSNNVFLVKRLLSDINKAGALDGYTYIVQMFSSYQWNSNIIYMFMYKAFFLPNDSCLLFNWQYNVVNTTSLPPLKVLLNSHQNIKVSLNTTIDQNIIILAKFIDKPYISFQATKSFRVYFYIGNIPLKKMINLKLYVLLFSWGEQTIYQCWYRRT